MQDPLFVRVGQRITDALWNALVRRVRSLRLLEGPGIRLEYTKDGTIITSKASDTATFLHPFRVTLSASGAAIRPGLVNGVEPVIGNVPLSGDAKNPPPLLDLRRPKVDQEGRGYIALEITCGPNWEITKGQAKVVQVAAWDTENGEPSTVQRLGAAGVPGFPGRRVRYPLALLRPNQAGTLEAVQIQMFHLQHSAKPRDAKSDVARHFFAMGGTA